MTSILLNKKIIDLSIPRVMAIINLTPDSFFDGGKIKTDIELLKITEKHISQGAFLLDIGGYSTRPDAEHITELEETKRIQGKIKIIKKNFPDIYISIDTFRTNIAKMAIEEGATLINDVSGGQLDPYIYQIASQYHVPYILTHYRGTPKTMNQLSKYTDIVTEVCDYLQVTAKKIRTQNINDIIIDPGFGFAKTTEQNFKLLQKMKYLTRLNMPMLVGISRKSFLYKTIETSPNESLPTTTALHLIALQNGANILRVHDPKEAIQTIKIYNTLKNT
ncbi:MAG: dihydropteroate synthase [Chitinophagaceae bacterium]|nr:dihydropteroate synthase [Chitinophagaceae bacterium]